MQGSLHNSATTSTASVYIYFFFLTGNNLNLSYIIPALTTDKADDET